MGVIWFSNNEKFIGNFKKDNANGIGVFIKNNGEVIIGNWVDNLL